MRRVFLIGYMGAGKTTIGRRLARKTGLIFYDLDQYIEARMHRTVARIFADEGEEGFRRIERAMLREVGEFENVVISCGGGTPCFYDNMDHMAAQGVTIYLRCTPDVLAAHLHMSHTVRPLLLGKSDEELLRHIEKHLAEREPYYLRAAFCIETGVLGSRDAIERHVDSIITLTNLYPER